jgi:uncharacterized membrane protein
MLNLCQLIKVKVAVIKVAVIKEAAIKVDIIAITIAADIIMAAAVNIVITIIIITITAIAGEVDGMLLATLVPGILGAAVSVSIATLTGTLPLLTTTIVTILITLHHIREASSLIISTLLAF